MEQQTKYDAERLLFRRQFILGPRFVEKFNSWKRIHVRNEICLTVHPDLSTCQVRSQNKAITLLGYILDPNDTEANDADILYRLLRDLSVCDSLDDFFKYTYDLGGRWILIIDTGTEIRLFHDPVGYRQVFFTKSDHSEELWCASGPALLAEVLNLQINIEASKFISTLETVDEEYWWPGDSTAYQETRCLLPNRYLNLRTGSYCRFWPDAPLTTVSLETGVERCADLLKGLLKSASNRFELAMTLTAGWDTRLLLAASREISRKISFYSFVYWNLTEDSADVAIPSRLLRRLDLKHQIIQCPASMEPEFERIYTRNVVKAHKIYGTIAQGLCHQYPQNSVCVKGNASTIAKCYILYLKVPPSERKEKITAAALAKLHHMEQDTFAMKAFDTWLSELGNIRNFHVLDLFQWEQKEARWQAMSQTEWDIVQEVFVPYNCRSLLIQMLSVPEEYRKPPEHKMYEAMVRRLWPEALSEPINPHQGQPPKEASTPIARGLMRMGLHRVIPVTACRRLLELIKRGLQVSVWVTAPMLC